MKLVCAMSICQSVILAVISSVPLLGEFRFDTSTAAYARRRESVPSFGLWLKTLLRKLCFSEFGVERNSSR